MRWKYQTAAVLGAVVAMSGAAIASPGPEASEPVAANGAVPVPADGDADAWDDGLLLLADARATTRDTSSEERDDDAAEPVEPEPSESMSIGRPNRGRLLDGVRLEESDVIRFKNGSPDTTAYGTAELVGMLERAAAHVAHVMPGSKLTVGDLSRRRGGWLRPHRSHRSGRDVDIAFYAVDAERNPLELPTFVRFRSNGEGRGRWGEGAVFDDARNWELVRAMLEDPVADVQYIFVGRWLRRRILRAGEERDAPREVLERASIAMEQPRRGGRHDDHFHVRIYCPDDDLERCRDEPPWRPWHPGPNGEISQRGMR